MDNESTSSSSSEGLPDDHHPKTSQRHFFINDHFGVADFITNNGRLNGSVDFLNVDQKDRIVRVNKKVTYKYMILIHRNT